MDPARLLPVLLQSLGGEPPESTVLELGCGDSALAAHLYDALGGKASIVATDVSETALAKARERFCESRPNLSFSYADATRLVGFEDGSVSLVIDKGLSDTLQHRAKAKQSRSLRLALFSEVFRVLAPEGIYAVATPKRQPQYLLSVPWARVERRVLAQAGGTLFDTSTKDDPHVVKVVEESVYVHVCRKPSARSAGVPTAMVDYTITKASAENTVIQAPARHPFMCAMSASERCYDERGLTSDAPEQAHGEHPDGKRSHAMFRALVCNFVSSMPAPQLASSAALRDAWDVLVACAAEAEAGCAKWKPFRCTKLEASDGLVKWVVSVPQVMHLQRAFIALRRNGFQSDGLTLTDAW